VIPDREHVANFDIEQVEDIDENVELFTALGTKVKLQRWVKKPKSQVGDRGKFKLKVVVMYDSIVKEVHMTQPVWFAAKDLITIACAW